MDKEQIPKLSKANSHVVGNEVFWIQKVAGVKVYKAWRYSDGALITLAQTKDRLKELLDERYPKYIKP